MMSRQQRYQVRHELMGLCALCAHPRVPYSAKYCRRHLIWKRRNARDFHGTQPWQKGRRGRPPEEVRLGYAKAPIA
jgi:hypothetical protein